MILHPLLAAASLCAAAELESGVAERQCYAQLADQTDHEMTLQWIRTLAALHANDDEIRKQKLNLPNMTSGLLASQRAWLRYREAQCSMVSDQAAGGTGYSEFDSRCRIQMNRQRTLDLALRAEGALNPPFP